MFVSLGVNESPEREPSLFDLPLSLSLSLPLEGLFIGCDIFFAICKWFSAFRFCFSAHLLIVSHFYFPCENRQRQREEGTGSCPKDPAGYGKNGYFVVLHWGTSVVAFVGFVMGLWFGCLGGWLMCRIVSRIVVYLLWYLLCFVFCFLFSFFIFLFRKRVLSARGCVRVCLQGVNCGKVALTDLQYWMISKACQQYILKEFLRTL